MVLMDQKNTKIYQAMLLETNIRWVAVFKQNHNDSPVHFLHLPYCSFLNTK